MSQDLSYNSNTPFQQFSFETNYGCVHVLKAKPLSSVGSIADLRTGGCSRFDPRLGQVLMIVIATGFIPLSPLSSDNDYVGKQPVAWKEHCAEYWSKGLQESMDRCTGCHDITEILLKMVLNKIQSIMF